MRKFVRKRTDGWRQNRRCTPSASAPRRRSLDLILFLLLPVGLWLSGSIVMRYAEHHPYFQVQEVLVEETAGFAPEDIQEWGGVKVGMSMWEVGPEQVESRLLSHPWLQSARVRRDFPQRVHIAVSARRPVAIVVHDALVYLDESGTCFAKPEQSPVADLPYVSGLTQVSLDSSTARSALEGVLHLLSLARLWQEPLSEIHWDPQQGYTLFLERRRITVRLGWENTPEKFAQIGVVLAEWREDALPVVLDARFAGQIVVRPYAGETSAQSRTLSRPL